MKNVLDFCMAALGYFLFKERISAPKVGAVGLMSAGVALVLL